MNVIQNPAIPLVTSVPGGSIQPGQMIMVHGEPLPHCNRFSVNLISVSNNNHVFHFDFRFDQNTTVRNNNFSGSWGPEERSPLTVYKGRPFFMEIRCTHDRFMVAIDGCHHSEFMHRTPFSHANALKIQGDVRVHMVEFKGMNPYPPSFPSVPSVPGHTGLPYTRLDVMSPTVPFTSFINGPMSVGTEVHVHGRVNPYPNRFSINLQQGHQASNVALHLNPRFEGGNRIIVLNHKSGNWGAEKRITGAQNPFYPNGYFQVRIRRQLRHFEIYINGKLLENFAHRISADMIDSLAIEGDVIVDRIMVN